MDSTAQEMRKYKKSVSSNNWKLGKLTITHHLLHRCFRRDPFVFDNDDVRESFWPKEELPEYAAPEVFQAVRLWIYTCGFTLDDSNCI